MCARVCWPLSLSLSLGRSFFSLFSLFLFLSPLFPPSFSHMTIFPLTPERIKSDTSGTRSGDITVNNVERRAPVHHRVRQRRRSRHQEHDTRDGGLFEQQVQRRQRPKSQTRKPHLEIDLHMHLLIFCVKFPGVSRFFKEGGRACTEDACERLRARKIRVCLLRVRGDSKP
jgi:hypothetical protein